MYSKAWDIVYCFMVRRDAALCRLSSAGDKPDIACDADSQTDSTVSIGATDGKFDFGANENKIEASKLNDNSGSSLKNDLNPRLQNEVVVLHTQLIQPIELANQEVLSAVEECYSQLSLLLDEIEVKAVITALTIQCDELVLIDAIADCSRQWPKLQRKILKINNGGNYFYRCLEQLMAQAAKNPFALKVYYLCLRSGFIGELYEKESELKALVSRLGALIDNPFISLSDESKIGNATTKKIEAETNQGVSVEDYLFGSAIR